MTLYLCAASLGYFVVAEVLGRVHVERDVRYRMIILYPMRPLSLDYSGRLRLYGGRGSDIYYLWWLWSAAFEYRYSSIHHHIRV